MAIQDNNTLTESLEALQTELDVQAAVELTNTLKRHNELISQTAPKTRLRRTSCQRWQSWADQCSGRYHDLVKKYAPMVRATRIMLEHIHQNRLIMEGHQEERKSELKYTQMLRHSQK